MKVEQVDLHCSAYLSLHLQPEKVYDHSVLASFEDRSTIKKAFNSNIEIVSRSHRTRVNCSISMLLMV